MIFVFFMAYFTKLDKNKIFKKLAGPTGTPRASLHPGPRTLSDLPLRLLPAAPGVCSIHGVYFLEIILVACFSLTAQ